MCSSIINWGEIRRNKYDETAVFSSTRARIIIPNSSMYWRHYAD
jgi:hypothetical protein